MLTPFQTSLKLECRPKGLRGCGREGSPWTAVGDGTPKGTRAGRAGCRPSPVTPFFSLHRGCRRPHGGLLCRRTSHGHSAQGLLTAIHLELQGMQVRSSVATAAPGWRAMGETRGGRGSVCQAPREARGRAIALAVGGVAGGRPRPPSSVLPLTPCCPLTVPFAGRAGSVAPSAQLGTVAESVSS